MQDAPNKETLLLALAKFLVAEVRPQVKDPRLSFRLLIAANLAGIVAQECAGEDEQNTAELARLARIFDDLLPASGAGAVDAKSATRATQLAAIRAGNERLAKGIRDTSLDASPKGLVFQHIKQTLAEKLAIDNPRFDSKRDLP
jgi:hypothetical protein